MVRLKTSNVAIQAASRSAVTLLLAAILGANTLPIAAQPAQSDPEATAPDVVSVVLFLLGSAGIDYSVSEAEIREWLADREFTPYPAIADALLLVADGRRLKQPVHLDVIVWNYEHAPGASSPRSIAEIDFAQLRAAVTAGYNERHGGQVENFAELWQ